MLKESGGCEIYFQKNWKLFSEVLPTLKPLSDFKEPSYDLHLSWQNSEPHEVNENFVIWLQWSCEFTLGRSIQKKSWGNYSLHKPLTLLMPEDELIRCTILLIFLTLIFNKLFLFDLPVVQVCNIVLVLVLVMTESKNHRIIHVGRDLWKHVVQPSAQSRSN